MTTDLAFESVWDALEDSADAAANMKLRSELMIAIQDWVGLWGVTQVEAAKRLAVSQPRLNDLLRGRIGKFSLDALVSLAARAGLGLRLEVILPAGGTVIGEKRSEGSKRLVQIATRLKSGESVAPITIRELLRWFGAKYRGVRTNEVIREALFENNLRIEPDFNALHIDSCVDFHGGVLMDKIEEQFYQNYRRLDEGSQLNEIEAAMLNKLYIERFSDCLAGWIDRNPGVTEREIRAKTEALNELEFEELENQDGAEIILLPEPAHRIGKLPRTDNLHPHVSANITVTKEISQFLANTYKKKKLTMGTESGS
jgi:predicted XRE-type DNA-binding protein